MNFIDKAVEEYAANVTTTSSELLKALASATHLERERPHMLTGHVEGQLLYMLARLINAVNVLEIGLFSGYSALSMAQALPENGKVFSLEKDEKSCEFAQSFLAQSPHGHKVTVCLGEALTVLKTLELPILDMVFLDADKRGNDAYFELLLPKLRDNGLIVIDNTLYKSGVLAPNDPQAIAIDALNKKLAVDPRVEVVLLTVRDGISLIRKKGLKKAHEDLI